MRAFTLDSFETTPRLRDDLPAPQVGPNELLVRVQTSSINPADAAVAAGMLKGMVEYEFPVTLGRDFAGVVETVGSSVSRYRVGDEVYGFLPLANPTAHAGSWADYAVVSEETSVARKPTGVDLATAGAAPVAGLTATAAIDALELAPGATVLVIGATGGVGSLFATSCSGSARATLSIATPMWPHRSARPTPTGSTRCSTWCRANPAHRHSSQEAASPHRSAQPEKARTAST